MTLSRYVPRAAYSPRWWPYRTKPKAASASQWGRLMRKHLGFVFTDEAMRRYVRHGQCHPPHGLSTMLNCGAWHGWDATATQPNGERVCARSLPNHKEVDMRIAIGAGHSPNCDGACAYGYSENHEARLICDAFEAICKRKGTACVRCDSDASTQAGYLNEQVRKFNAAACDVSLQIHLNAGGGTGCECWYKNAPYNTAMAIAANMADTLGLRNRGAKYSSNLRILNDVRYRPYIVEVCFIDKWTDIQALQGKHAAVAAAIYTAVTGEEVEDDMDFRIEAPSVAYVGQKVKVNVIPDYTFNHVWRYGDTWDDWGSDMKDGGEAVDEPNTTFTPTKTGKYNIWADVFDAEGNKTTTPFHMVNVIPGEAPQEPEPSVGIDYDRLADVVISKLIERLKD